MRRVLLVGLLLAAGCRHAGARVGAPTPAALASSTEATPEVPDAVRGNGLSPPEPVSPHAVDGSTRDAFARAVAEARSGETARSEASFRALLRRQGGLDYAWTDLGVVLEREADLRGAEDAYRRALALAPAQPEAWDFLTRLYCREGQARKAELLIRAQVQKTPGGLGVRNALAFSLLEQGRLTDAAAEAKKVLKADERNVRAMQLLAQVYAREHKDELARMVLENAAAIAPSDAATYNALGLVQLALRQKARALESFQKAAQLQPDFAEARNNYGAMLNASEDYDGAVRELEAAVRSAPDMVAARLNLGNAYRGKQDAGRARQAYEAVLRLNPALPDTYFNLGVLHLDSEVPGMEPVERLKAAIAYFQQYAAHGGQDEQVGQYVKDATRGIEREERRKERERREQLRKGKAGGQASKGTSAPAPSSGKLPGNAR